jgi:hypothetical protein
MTDSMPSSSIEAGIAAPEPQICKEIRIEKSELKASLKKKRVHRIEPNIPAGLKLATHFKPESSSPDVLQSGLASGVRESKKREPRKELTGRTTTTAVSTEYPYSTIGVLFVGSALDFSNPTGRGTAVVVAANNMVVTAASFIPWGAPGGWWARFVPGFHDGNEPFGSAFATKAYGSIGDIPTDNNNYVVIELDSPIGERCGAMGAYSTTDSDAYLAYQNWNSVGYSADAPIAALGLPIERDDDSGENLKIFYALEVFDARNDPGWYGAPMYGNVGGMGPYVIAVLSGNFYDESDEVNYMVYAGGPGLISDITWGVAHFS